MSQRTEFDWAIVSCAAAAKVDGKKISQARVVLGAVSNIPYQVEAANQYLEGKELDAAATAKVADLILEKVHVQSNNGYKIPIMRALIHRTLMQLTA
jgi:xanthine dehydrogenase YagS FAD-binding subunit